MFKDFDWKFWVGVSGLFEGGGLGATHLLVGFIVAGVGLFLLVRRMNELKGLVK